MATLTIGRLALGKPPAPFTEALGDPLATVGGAVVPGSRAAPSFTIALATYLDGSQLGSVGVASGQLLRRALRSMLNNSDLKLQGFFYVVYNDDLEQNGWYAPDATQLTSQDNQAGFGAGLWQTSGNWYVLGRRRTHREGRQIWMKALGGAQYPRDYLGLIQSSDFSALPALQLSVLPNGATQIMNNVSGQVVVGVVLPTGRDGGVCQQISGQSDLTVLSYERAEASLNLSDVIVYDRRADAANFCEFPLTANTVSQWTTAAPGAFIVGGATLAPDNTPAAIPIGSYAGKFVTTIASAQEGAAFQLPGTFLSGVAYTASVYLKGNAGGEAIRLTLGDSGGNSTNAALTLTTGWQRLSVTWTPSANRTSVYIAVTSNTGSAYTFWANGAQVTRAGAAVTFATAESGWEEVYGPDYPWNWLTAGQPNDCPVLDNGLIRVRYDSTNTPGFRVDVWNGSAYDEQGKMLVERFGDLDTFDDTWVSASLVEYTPDRAVISCVLSSSTDAVSRERIFITVQRGELGCVFEVYPALRAAGTQSDLFLRWHSALDAGVADLNSSAIKIDSQGATPLPSWTPGAAGTAVYVATAGTGAGTGNSGQFPGGFAALGAASFAASENWIAILRCPVVFNVISAYQAAMVVLQAGAGATYAGGQSAAYGATTNAFRVGSSSGAGYFQCQLQFAATQADQIMEAEAMTLGANTSLATVASSSGPASNNATTATRTTDANAHVTRATWPNGFLGTYRVFVRVKVSASTGHFYAKTGSTTGAAVTTTSTSYVWLDLGEIVANNTTLEIHAWLTAAATVTVDRVEAVLVQDRARGSAIFSGSRDAGQAALSDSRTLGRLVAR